MARKKKKKSGGGGGGDGWLVTFSDLMTLLLTFFVLLLSMSSLDNTIVQQVFSIFIDKPAFLSHKASGRIEHRFKVLKEIIAKQFEILDNEQRIKDLLFPDEILPREISKSTLDKNLRILKRPEGVALVLTDKLLFPLGKTTLTPAAEKILQQIAILVSLWPAPVNIAGYTDNIPARTRDNYEIAAERALSVLTFFVKQGVKAVRLSVSAYGPNFPLADNMTEQGRAQNRRVEILLKTNNNTYL
jgi:chemotaxis protein MotB